MDRAQDRYLSLLVLFIIDWQWCPRVHAQFCAIICKDGVLKSSVLNLPVIHIRLKFKRKSLLGNFVFPALKPTSRESNKGIGMPCTQIG